MAVRVRGNPEPGPLTRCVMLGQRADVAAFSDPEPRPSKPPTENIQSIVPDISGGPPRFYSRKLPYFQKQKKELFCCIESVFRGHATAHWPQSLCHLFVGQKQFAGRSPGSVTSPSLSHAHGQRRHHTFGTNTEVANLHPGTGMETQITARLARNAPCRDPLVPSSVPTSVAVLVLVLETAF
jgi:hypothetical protein